MLNSMMNGESFSLPVEESFFMWHLHAHGLYREVYRVAGGHANCPLGKVTVNGNYVIVRHIQRQPNDL
jgi:hypothetical protein